MPQSDLDLVIEALENECANLRSKFDLCLEIQDYYNAEHYNDLLV